MFKNLFSITTLASLVAPVSLAGWMTDFEAAKAKAAQENKAVLVFFTGSDWCGYCMALRKDVLDTPGFTGYADGKFVLMEVDMPHKKQRSPELARQNDILCNQYTITGFPTVLVMSPEGRVLGGFHGYRESLEEVVEPLEQAFVTWELLQKADTATGDAKAMALMEAYESMPEDVRENSTLLHEVVEADANNVTGIQEREKDELEIKELDAQLRACGGDVRKMQALLEKSLETARPNNREMIARELEGVKLAVEMEEIETVLVDKGYAPALAMVEEKLAMAEGERRLMLLATKLQYQTLMAETVEDLEKAKATAREMRELMPPDMQADFDDYIESMYGDTQALLQQVKEIRDNQEQIPGVQ